MWKKKIITKKSLCVHILTLKFLTCHYFLCQREEPKRKRNIVNYQENINPFHINRKKKTFRWYNFMGVQALKSWRCSQSLFYTKPWMLKCSYSTAFVSEWSYYLRYFLNNYSSVFDLNLRKEQWISSLWDILIDKFLAFDRQWTISYYTSNIFIQRYYFYCQLIINTTEMGTIKEVYIIYIRRVCVYFRTFC